MVHKIIMAAASLMLISAPVFAQQEEGAAGVDATALRQYHRALNNQGGSRKMMMGRSAYAPKHHRMMRSTPANSGTYGGTQIPGHGGAESGQ